MKTILFLLLALPLWGQPTWIPKGAKLEPALPGQTKWVTASGNSMNVAGLYPTRALVPLPYSKLKIGMWVARAQWKPNGEIAGYVSHRIVGRNGPTYVLQGDNKYTNRMTDRIPLTFSNYAGVVCDPVTLKPL